MDRLVSLTLTLTLTLTLALALSLALAPPLTLTLTLACIMARPSRESWWRSSGGTYPPAAW